MTKPKSYYFKKTFYLVFVGLFTYTIIRGLFEGDFSTEGLLKLFLIASVSGVVTGSLFGFINMMWLKRDNFFISNKKPIDKQ